MDYDIFDLPPQRLFDTLGNDAGMWSWKAECIMQAADVVEESCGPAPEHPTDEASVGRWIEMHGVVRMLWGMAFECFLKAIWLKYGGQLAWKGKYRGIPGAKDHDLCALEKKVSEKVKTRLNMEEKRLLARLSFFITYGRYPIRKSVSHKHPTAAKNGKPVFWCKWETADGETLDRIYEKLSELLAG